MWRLWVQYVLVCILLATFCPSLARAQGNGAVTTALTGSVTDPSGAVVRGAQLKLINTGTGTVRNATTADNGTYVFPQLAPATYRLQVTSPGFQSATYDHVVVVIGLTSTLDIGLRVGEVSQSVSVEANVAGINTQDASLGTAFTETEIVQLPLEARNIVSLLALQAGATYVPTNDIRSGSIQGSRSDQSVYTLDGVNVNDPENQLAAYQTTLRIPADSVQEFRTATNNYGAELGGGGGAQVQLVTKTGTNSLHGALYEYLRNTATSSNEYFNEAAGVPTPKLNKNVFGAAAGGPIKKDRLFIFGNFEGFREVSAKPTLRYVPSDALRDGVIVYNCAVPAQCPGGTAQGVVSSHIIPAGSYGLTPAQFAAIDPRGLGPTAAVLAHFQQYPHPNDPGLDGLDIDGYRYAGPFSESLNTGVIRLDYKVDNAGKYNLFWRATIQDDTLLDVPQFPGEPPNSTARGLNKGMVLGFDSVWTPRLLNAFRWGYTRAQASIDGLQRQPQISFYNISDLPAKTPSSGEAEPTHEFRDDLTWSKGSHTFQFGFNTMIARIPRFSNGNSFSSVGIDPYWLLGTGEIYLPGSSTCTTPGCNAVPAVASDFGGVWSYTSTDLWGLLTRGAANYNYTKTGALLPVGAPVARRFGSDEYAYYVQDQWRIRPSLTLSLGLRHELFSPPWETNGNQVCPNPGPGTIFNARRAGMFNGIPSNAQPPMSFDLCGPANGKAGFYPWDPTNFSPRAAVAWNPHFSSGLKEHIFGNGKTVIRGGYSLVYDHVGMALARTYDTGGGTFGLSASLSAPIGTVNEDTAVRYSGEYNLPGPPTIPAAPAGGFPNTPPEGSLLVSNTVDNTIVTPRIHVYNLTIERQLPGKLTLQASYVGRLGRNLLTRKDFGMPLDLVDPKSGMDLYTAASILGKLAEVGDPRGLSVGTDTHLVKPVAYWEDMFPGAAGKPFCNIYGVGAASTATQTMYDLFLCLRGDYMDGMAYVDEIPGSPFYSKFGPYTYYLSQFCCYVGQSTIGYSNYNALELSLGRKFSQGLQFNFNYTYSHSLDTTSDAERGSVAGNLVTGGVTSIILDSWFPQKSYSNSDFDLRHQVNASWMYALPVGRGRKFGSDMPGWANQILGGWEFSGIYRWTSGFPFNVLSCADCFTTNDTLANNAVLLTSTTALPATSVNKGATVGPNAFSDPTAALNSFKPGIPGEIGLRNVLRGDGYFAIDSSLRKVFPLTADASKRLAFAWDTFNLTNTPKFDTASINAEIDVPGTFGRYTRTLATCDGVAGRCMQFSLRFEF